MIGFASGGMLSAWRAKPWRPQLGWRWFFFFQAEDGIRDPLVTGVQTCALPISRVLFLDEPTVGLDPRIRHELLDAIGALRARRDLTLLVTTHYLDEAERLCDRVAIMHLGRIVALDTPDALRASLGAELVELRVDGDGGKALARLRELGLAGREAFAVGSTLTVPLAERGAAAAVAGIEAVGLPVTAISTRNPTLDDVYLRLTGGRLAEAA